MELAANDATEISLSKNIDFDGTLVNAGRYRMYAVPDRETWHITLNSEIGKFGYNEPDYSLDVVTVDIPLKLPRRKRNNSLSVLTMILPE